MNAKVADAPVAAVVTPDDLAALAAWRAQAAEHLVRLETVADGLSAGELDAPLRLDAGAVESFFSETARRHLVAVERCLTTPLIAAGAAAAAEQVASARTLLQDAGWFEQTWLELAPQLRAVAEGSHWIDPTEFVHDVEVLRELGDGLLAREAALAAAPSGSS